MATSRLGQYPYFKRYCRKYWREQGKLYAMGESFGGGGCGCPDFAKCDLERQQQTVKPEFRLDLSPAALWMWV